MSSELQATQQTDQDHVNAVYTYAAQLFGQGKSARAVEADLIQLRVDPQSANTVAYGIQNARTKMIRKSGARNMLVGGLWAVGGTVVTVVSYQAVANGGGSYVVAWGAILFGLIQFFRGFAQFASGR